MFEKFRIGQSAAKHRIGERSTTRAKARRIQVNPKWEESFIFSYLVWYNFANTK